MPYVKAYIHFVWCTKNREPYLHSPEVRRTVWEHIKDNAAQKDIFIDTINGYQEHCHCLISLGIDQTISKVMQLVKGELSYWINKNQLSKHKFQWQDEYFAVSVSPSNLDQVRAYIRGQEEHHRNQTCKQELDDFIEKLGFQKIKD